MVPDRVILQVIAAWKLKWCLSRLNHDISEFGELRLNKARLSCCVQAEYRSRISALRDCPVLVQDRTPWESGITLKSTLRKLKMCSQELRPGDLRDVVICSD